MDKKIPVGISARHVHLSQDDLEFLFGFDYELTPAKELSQPNTFACDETVTIKTDDGKEIKNVRIVGPFRNYNQVEISKTDAWKLKLNPPVRTSGAIAGSEHITLRTEKASVTLDEGCIIADRHVHFNTKDQDKYHVKNGDKLKLHILGEKRGTIEVFAKVSDDGYYEVHLDTDDANAFLLNTGDEVVLEIPE